MQQDFEKRNSLIEKIKSVNDQNFDSLAKEVYAYQSENNPTFQSFLSHIQFDCIDDFIYLPISAFKHHKVKTGLWQELDYFESSGTTGSIHSKHYYQNIDWYIYNCKKAFEKVYGAIEKICFLALLPHYLERKNSSLIAMVRHFITKSKYKQSGFFLNEINQLKEILKLNAKDSVPTVLFGVSFALKDFAENYSINYPNLTIIETGGMKGRQREITRAELHSTIKDSFGVNNIHSEYGMTELLSQAYSIDNGRFYPAPTMKVQIQEIGDPMVKEKNGKTGIINIIDLANIDTCSFIATEDIGRKYEDGSFEVLGRLDNSDMRGCNLMLS